MDLETNGMIKLKSNNKKCKIKRKIKTIKINNSQYIFKKKILIFLFLIIFLIQIGLIYYFLIKNKKNFYEDIRNIKQQIKNITEEVNNITNITIQSKEVEKLYQNNNTMEEKKVETNSKIASEIISKRTFETTSEIVSPNELEEITFEEFNEDILNKYKEQQNKFCANESKYYNLEYENKIKEVNVEYLGKYFKMFVYKSEDIVSVQISGSKVWEKEETKKLIKILDYYSIKKKIAKENLYVLDIGANIGWYTFFLGKYGYKILSFEPSYLNMYILHKNYCLNRKLNVTLIRKGLYTEEKNCDFYISKGNIGDGWVLCDKNASDIPKHLIKSGQTILTRLSNYVSFLSKNNLALIKIDVEGSEEKSLTSGLDLFTKYNIPFIFLEFTPDSLKIHNSEPKEFLMLFERNGYKFSTDDFLSGQYKTADEIIQQVKGYVNLYIVHSSILNDINQ